MINNEFLLIALKNTLIFVESLIPTSIWQYRSNTKDYRSTWINLLNSGFYLIYILLKRSHFLYLEKCSLNK